MPVLLPAPHHAPLPKGPTIGPLSFAEIMMRSTLALAIALLVSGAALAQPAPVTTASGVVYESLVEGTGIRPQGNDRVKVHYRGISAQGKEIDSSYQRGEPAEFPLQRVIPCWREALRLMQVGGKARITCPPATTYGMRGSTSLIPSNETLQFEIELLDVR